MRIATAIAVAGLLAAGSAMAAPLPPEACSALKQEYQSLVSAGAKGDMDRGAAWAKANLAPDRLGKIERLISVEEQLSFRCDEQLTARPVIKELPKPEGEKTAAAQAQPNQPAAFESVGSPKGVASNIPPPKRKDAAKASGKKQAATE